jgi:hypothetical protein
MQGTRAELKFSGSFIISCIEFFLVTPVSFNDLGSALVVKEECGE